MGVSGAPAAPWLYLHGLGTGPRSSKGERLAAWLATEGVPLYQPDLRVPYARRPRMEAMIDAACVCVDPDHPPVLFGASAGGLVALHVAHRTAVRAVVLFAPALDLPDHRTSRPWTSRAWRALGRLPFRDKADGKLIWIDDGFLTDTERYPAPPPAVPTLIFHGRRDRMVDIRVSRRLAAEGGHMRLVELDDGHDQLASMETILREARTFVAPWLPPSPGAS